MWENKNNGDPPLTRFVRLLLDPAYLQRDHGRHNSFVKSLYFVAITPKGKNSLIIIYEWEVCSVSASRRSCLSSLLLLGVRHGVNAMHKISHLSFTAGCSRGAPITRMWWPSLPPPFMVHPIVRKFTLFCHYRYTPTLILRLTLFVTTMESHNASANLYTSSS